MVIAIFLSNVDIFLVKKRIIQYQSTQSAPRAQIGMGDEFCIILCKNVLKSNNIKAPSATTGQTSNQLIMVNFFILSLDLQQEFIQERLPF